MKTYPKIPALWKRGSANHQIMPGIFQSPLVSYMASINWIFTEKVKGTCVEIEWDGYGFDCRCRTKHDIFFSPDVDEIASILYNDRMHEIFDQKFGDSLVSLYGIWNGYGICRQESSVDYTKHFFLCDIAIDGAFLDWDIFAKVASELKLRTVPKVMYGNIYEAIDFLKSAPVSRVDASELMEGIIGKPPLETQDRLGNRAIVKIRPQDVQCN